MPRFQRQTITRFIAFQFKMIELNEREAENPPVLRARYQSKHQWFAFADAGMPLKLSDIGLTHFEEGKPPVLAVTVSVHGHAGTKVHLLQLGDWLVVEPRTGKLAGEVLTDEQFRALGAVQV